MSTIWQQYLVTLKARRRGFHLVTQEITSALTQLAQIDVGFANLFIQHTSASLTINENADPTVREDFESYFNHAVRENEPYYQHTFEGPDDMPAHLKTSLLGASHVIPIQDGRLALGTWQGIYLCEHRDHPSPRRVLVTLTGRAR